MIEFNSCDHVLKNLKIILMEPETPGNIGASARAMQCMGLHRLRLVNPKRYPSREASARAVGATEILDRVQLYSCLRDAIADCDWVFGTSGQIESLHLPKYSPRDAAEEVVKHAQRYRSPAVIFGRESRGLTLEELSLCHAIIRIPTSPMATSLNLGSAVQIICYELWTAHMSRAPSTPTEEMMGHQEALASAGQRDHLLTLIETLAIELGALDPENPRQMMKRLRMLFSREQATQSELSLLQSILKRALKAAQSRS